MKNLVDLYIRRVRTIGALYAIIPTLVWMAGTFWLMPFRYTYVLRTVLAVCVGGWIAAIANEYAVRLWLVLHRSPQGPAGAWDGMMLGAAAGFGTAFVAPLTALIRSHHLDEAVTFIMASWLVSAMIGCFWGAVLGSFGAAHVSREELAAAPPPATPAPAAA